MISNTKISTMSEAIILHEDNSDKYISTMSGNVDLTKCTVENIHTMSGDIKAISTTITQDIDTMSGNIVLVNCTAWDVHTMSGNVSLHETELDSIDTLSGKVSCFDSKINKISCINLGRVDRSQINRIYIKDNKSKTIHSNDNITINNETISGDDIHIYYNGHYSFFDGIRNLFKKNKNKKIIIELPVTSKVQEIEFESEGIVKSYYDLKVINGTLEKLN